MARQYAAILGNLGNTRDRFCSGYKTSPTTVEMLQQAASLPITGIELVGTWDIRPENAKEMKRALDDLARIIHEGANSPSFLALLAA